MGGSVSFRSVAVYLQSIPTHNTGTDERFIAAVSIRKLRRSDRYPRKLLILSCLVSDSADVDGNTPWSAHSYNIVIQVISRRRKKDEVGIRLNQ